METDVMSKPHRLKFDAFLSFRGEETRHNITKRIYDALNVKEKFRVFRDNDGLEGGGDETSPNIVEAMKDSAASVVVSYALHVRNVSETPGDTYLL